MTGQRNSQNTAGTEGYAPFERRLLNDYQHELPLVPRPFAAIGERLGVGEQAVLDALIRFREQGVVSRVGATLKPGTVGAATLAAMAVPAADMERVAALISARPEVNHNYEREHELNLWFVAMAPDDEALRAVLAEIEAQAGYPLLDLRLVCDYHLDLGFDILWISANGTGA
ncbi:MAG: Lrp/AsnC family transcriptional regulator [Ectothiorhodospiraceae bacterium]|nr:Lrp/AsnC family transcriptional regulator [Ectothiorhodospiraceae bacterium]